ncbi:MAG TPA: hypothetical protein VHW91_02275 [Candidatus Dormibacteraeota bacterium]|nr:hypothetical protein [Candidatus Dormibacteraeota bacterium]
MRPAGAILLGPVLILFSACSSAAGQPAKQPTAAEILNKPNQADVKDAHFTLTARIASSNLVLDATGDGVIVIKPQQASKFTMQMIVQGQTLKFVEVIAGGKEYDLSPDNPRWTVKPAGSSNPASFKGTNATLLGEDTLPLGKAWHVKATDDGGNPFEAWIRERDGYPLKYTSSSQGNSLAATFDHFNTGETVTPPPASDIQQ